MIVLACFVIGMIIFTKVSGIDEWFNLESIKSLILGSGVKGILIYIGLFTLGTFMSLPGMLFIVVAFVVYGSLEGSFVAYLGALVAVTLNFMVIRQFGGSGLEDIQKPWVQKLLRRLDSKPISSIIILRSILWISPPINYTLALSSLSSRNYIIGTAIGLVLPMVFLTSLSMLWMDKLIQLIS